MPKSRRKKVPVTSPNSISSHGAAPGKPRSTHTAAIIRRFHTLLKEETKHRDAGDLAALHAIQDEMEKLGGLEAYQQMSAVGQGDDRGGGTEKVFIGWLKDLGVHKRPDVLQLLEVGALKPDNYTACSSWISNTPMDLHSRHPQILEQDFLQMDPLENANHWDAISLSLVVNFVPSASDRGAMLRLAYTMLKPVGYLFLALPLPCVQNSRYLTFDLLTSIMSTIGFIQVQERWRKGGKMAYWLYRKDVPKSIQEGLNKKRVLKTGNRNNFCILLG